MEKRSTPNKTAKYVLVFILIAAAAAVLIFCLVNNNKLAQAKAYGESYAAALIADIQGSSAVEYTVKKGLLRPFIGMGARHGVKAE